MIVNFNQAADVERTLLGLKGTGLADMVSLGLSVPPGFIITTDVSGRVHDNGGIMPDDVWQGVLDALKQVEQQTGRTFGGAQSPLLLSVRSGSNVLMPGMMDTILNIGISDSVVETLARDTGNTRYAYDCYRRFLQFYAEIVLQIDKRTIQAASRGVLNSANVEYEDELDEARMKEVVDALKKMVEESGRGGIPEAPLDQLRAAVRAVYASWNNPRAITYRRLYRIAMEHGASITIQAMVYGNLNENSATGMMNTRDPTTGEKTLYGEFISQAQGEDVLSGRLAPLSLKQLGETMPVVFDQLKKAGRMLEEHYRDVQEIEFTVQDNELFLLQTRKSPRTARAAIKIAVDMAREDLISREQALMMVNTETLNQILHQNIDSNVAVKSVARGVPASPGAACGSVVFDIESAERSAEMKQQVILVRPETTTEDVRGLAAAVGVLTRRGGRTSHAAVVARGMGKPCVAGCEAIIVNTEAREFTVGDVTVREGDIITIDGSSGRVFLGKVPMRRSQLTDEFRELLAWCDQVRAMGVRANTDSPEDAKLAMEFGAEGIGLCRTEQMFQTADRLPVMRAMIMSHTERERREHLKELSAMQQQDFIDIFNAMQGRPVTFRLLDAPLHEFLIPLDTLLMEVALLRAQGARGREMEAKEELLSKVLQLKETNPMMGLRGCRLGILFPEINEMQLNAIFEAACNVARNGGEVNPEIMIPLVGHVNELKLLRGQVDTIAAKVMERYRVEIPYKFGALIEIPRAALTAAKLADICDFFSFGTNDLTQTTFGFSRDDAERKFLLHYLDQGILNNNPFETIDVEGVGRLMAIAGHDGRQVKEDLVLGICGEHGGELETIRFCQSLAVNYVSCSAFQVPIARLAAAQVVIAQKLKSQ
jgi:pyruvate,orthophosphate dikinase